MQKLGKTQQKKNICWLKVNETVKTICRAAIVDKVGLRTSVCVWVFVLITQKMKDEWENSPMDKWMNKWVKTAQRSEQHWSQHLWAWSVLLWMHQSTDRGQLGWTRSSVVFRLISFGTSAVVPAHLWPLSESLLPNTLAWDGCIGAWRYF